MLKKILMIGLAVLPAWTAVAADAPSEEWARALGRLPVRSAPDNTSARIGWIHDASFAWTKAVEGKGCETTYWAALVGGGFVCMTNSERTTEAPEALPKLIRFDSPQPDEWEAYLETYTWDRDPDTADALLPFVYGKRWRKWDAPVFESLEAWGEGEEPVGRLPGGGGRKSHFVAVEETGRGAVLIRDDGRVVPVAQTHIYPIDRFAGRDLEADPVAEGWLPGWVIAYEGAALLDKPDGSETGQLDYHAPLEVREADDGWWEVRDSRGRTGFLDDRQAMHHWVPRPAPAGVSADMEWLDVDLGQQVLAIRRGEDVRFATLISGGRTGRTPTGLYQVLDKSIHDDMASSAGAEDTYHVEEVPWVVHFRSRYALHGTFWHWGFGHRASHGCVNLSPRDAQYVFDAVHPLLPKGWHSVVARSDDPGTLVRIRDGDGPVKDRR